MYRVLDGAPEEIRTPDPQIRSLVLYPAELRARFSLRLGLNSPSASENVFGRSRKSALATGSGLIWQGPERRHLSGSSFRGRIGANPEYCTISSRFRVHRGACHRAARCAGPLAMPRNDGSGPRALVAYAQEFHRPVRYRDPEGRADGPFHQIDLPAMGADQFGGNRKAEPAAAGPGR